MFFVEIRGNFKQFLIFVKVYNNTDKGYKILLPTNNGFFDNTEAVGVVRDRSYGT